MGVSYQYPTPIGALWITETDAEITALGYHKPDTPFEHWETDVLREGYRQLVEYFAGERREFHLPLHPRGTPFQQEVWEALQKIPYGETRSYRQIAEAIGRPNACRAVGGANHHNPIMIVIPCHRVVGADGSLTGYASGLEVKQKLLRLEQGNQP